jgi:4-diphosphocytidyl-2-C-methyl-D-erythritol kinase
MATLKLLAYAKVNLYLAVFEKRSDGYHEIKSILQNISISDKLTFEESDRFEVISNLPIRPKENLVTKAAQAIMPKNKINVKITLTKNIPIAAGLGGGSSDAAATLIGLNNLFNLGQTNDELLEHAKKIGADVPFFLKDGTALIEGMGEKVSPLVNNTNLSYIIAKPQYGVRSHEAYHRFDEEPGKIIPPIDDLIEALKNGDDKKTAANIANMLEPPVINGHPQIQLIKEKALEAGALNAMLSGSGSSVFCLADSKEAAKNVAKSLKEEVSDVFIAEACEFAHEEI